jgi:hypothetical protein
MVHIYPSTRKRPTPPFSVTPPKGPPLKPTMFESLLSCYLIRLDLLDAKVLSPIKIKLQGIIKCMQTNLR